MSDLKQEIVVIVCNIARLNSNINIDTQASLKDLGVDSLELVNVFLNITERFGVEIPDEKIDELKNIDMIAAYLNQQLGNT